MKIVDIPFKFALLLIALLLVTKVEAQNNTNDTQIKKTGVQNNTLETQTKTANTQTNQFPDQIKFVRQAVKRFNFDEYQKIPLASLKPAEIIGMSAMHPVTYYSDNRADIEVENGNLLIQSEEESQASIWFGGFNPYATYTIDLISCEGGGELGFEFSNHEKTEQFIITINYNGNRLLDVSQKYIKDSKTLSSESILNKNKESTHLEGKITLQMLGSGLTLFIQNSGLPIPIAQSEFATIIDLREKEHIQSLSSNLYFSINSGTLAIKEIESSLSTGIGLADIRAITYENGEAMLDQNRLWYTMSIRGRALPHHIQGVFSLNPTIFDLRFEGVILFDRNDGLLRNEIASHIFYDRKDECWRGITTGFSAFAKPTEKKQLLAVESRNDPRFGFSVMSASPMGIIGDLEDPHIIFDSDENKWRMLVCENIEGYKAIMLESDEWNKNYQRIAGPVKYNSTGTSIQQIGNKKYCFSGSQDRKVYIYTYPDLSEAGILNIDLPPWDETSGTRVWPNIIQLPDTYHIRYIALMMDRFNYPELEGPNWTYGALYLYHGFD